MLIYRVKYTESESDIQNYSSFYKSTKKPKILSKKTNIFEKSKNFKNKINFVFCTMYKLYNSIFGIFGNFGTFGFLDFYLYTCVVLVVVWSRRSLETSGTWAERSAHADRYATGKQWWCTAPARH